MSSGIFLPLNKAKFLVKKKNSSYLIASTSGPLQKSCNDIPKIYLLQKWYT